RFPDYHVRERDPAWEVLKRKLTVGQIVSGTVVARAEFGVFIDLGFEFPGQLDIIVMAGLTPDRCQAGDWCPVGSPVTATIGCFDDRNHQIKLWQVLPRSARVKKQ